MIRRFAVVALCAASFGAGALWAHPSTDARGALSEVEAQQAQNTTRREPQFENEHVKVWKSIIMPRQPLSLHRHDHGRTIVALEGGQLKVVDKNNTALDTYNWETGKAYWLGPDPAGQMHGDLNDTAQPIEVIVVEMKNDVKK